MQKAVRFCARHIPLCLLLLIAPGLSPVFAQFMPVPPLRANEVKFQYVASWTFANGAEGPTIVDFNRGFGPGDDPTAWQGILASSAANGAGAKTLTVGARHLKPPHPGEDPDFFFRNARIRNLKRGGKGAAAVQTDHGPLGHVDIVRASATVPAVGAASITSSGEHTGYKLTQGSVQGISGTVKVIARYDDDTERVVLPATRVRPRDHLTPSLEDPTNKNKKVKGYRVLVATGGDGLPDPITETTLAFLGDVNDLPGMLDLGAATDLFVGTDEFLAPVLSDPNGQTLYVGIDLTQWLSFPTPLNLLDEFHFSSGMSDELPGILVGTSPVTFDSTLGTFVTDNPAFGTFQVQGFIDGQTVPEPGSLAALAALSLMGSLFALRLRRRK